MTDGNQARTIAFDRATVRSYDKDGHLHIEQSNISKACVNPYNGVEIPDWEGLGLDPNQVYMLLRDPEELAKAAPTFRGKPLLFVHKPTTAHDHQGDDVVGAVMNPRFEAPYLKAELVIWPVEAIKAVEDEGQKELSCGYRYRADMTPGTYEGEAYDGVMRDIVANHVALVAEGRAGPDVVVGDSAHQTNPEMEHDMQKHVLSRKAAATHGALSVYLAPKLAKDHKMPDLSPILAKVTAKTFKADKPKIATDVKSALAGKMAKDASLDDLTGLLDALEAVDPVEDGVVGLNDNAGAGEGGSSGVGSTASGAEAQRGAGGSTGSASDAEPLDQIKELLGKLSDEDKAALAAILSPAAQDEEDDEAKKKTEAEEKDKADKEKQAMDAKHQKDIANAIAAERANQAAIRDALNEVRPLVGDLHIAADNANGVYEAVLKMREIDTKGIDPSAFRAMVGMLPKQAKADPAPLSFGAMDAAQRESFTARFPNAGRLKN